MQMSIRAKESLQEQPELPCIATSRLALQLCSLLALATTQSTHAAAMVIEQPQLQGKECMVIVAHNFSVYCLKRFFSLYCFT